MYYIPTKYVYMKYLYGEMIIDYLHFPEYYSAYY